MACTNPTAKLSIFSGIHKSKEHFEIVHAEHTTISDFATFAGGEQFHIAPTSVKVISQGYDVTEFEYRAVAFPHGNIDRVAGVEHGASGGDMNGVHGL